ncbi:MAG TPA: VanZ family protein [Thermomicrobiales bacterium]|nr:VanZ family protein [Thermomicrobiales bacterium]
MTSGRPSIRSVVVHFLPALSVMAVIFTFSDQPKLPQIPSLSTQITSVAGHFTVYLVLALLLWWALGVFDLSTRQRYAIAFVIATLYGISDEWHQSFVPGRQPDVLDVLTDAIGVTTGLLAIHLAHRSERLRALVPR